jgi:hypothetical protein
MRNVSAWPAKVAALLKSGNVDGALAQIKVAPTVKDLTVLQKLVAGDSGRMGRSAENTTVSNAIKDQIVALSSPRLHRSP